MQFAVGYFCVCVGHFFCAMALVTDSQNSPCQVDEQAAKRQRMSPSHDDGASMSELEVALKNKDHALHGLFATLDATGVRAKMSSAALLLADQPTKLISKMWQMLFDRKAFGDRFHKEEGMPISCGSHGWCAPWSNTQALTSLQTAHKYQSAVSGRHVKVVSTKHLDWEKIRLADDQYFSHELLESGKVSNVDFKTPFHSTIKDTSLLPGFGLAATDGFFELDKSHEVFFGGIFGAWKAYILGKDMTPYARCFRSVVICLHVGEDTRDTKALRHLQHGQNAIAEYFISKDSCLDLAYTYKEVVRGITDRGEKATAKAILKKTDAVKWCSKTATEAKFTERTLSAVKSIATTFLDHYPNWRAIRTFNCCFGPDVLCSGYWHLDGLKQTCINQQWIPRILDRLRLYLRRQTNGCSLKRLTIDNIRGKPIGKNSTEAVLGYSSLFALQVMIEDNVLAKVGIVGDHQDIVETFRSADLFEEAFPTTAYVMEMNKLGKSVSSNFPAKMQALNEPQRLACSFVEKVANGEKDDLLRQAWVALKGDMADTPARFSALMAASDELKASYNEIMHALDFLTKHVVEKKDGLSVASLMDTEVPSDCVGAGEQEQRGSEEAASNNGTEDICARLFCNASRNRMKHQQIIGRGAFKSKQDVTDFLNFQIAEMLPSKGQRHIVIPIDIAEGPERAKSPWHKQAKLSNFMQNLIQGAVAVMRPGIFLFVSAGRDPECKYQVFQLMNDKKGHEMEELPSPAEVTLVGGGIAVRDVSKGGASAGSFQARNVQTVWALTSKSCNWRTVKKMQNIFDKGKTSFRNDMELRMCPPRDELQISKEEKLAIWKDIEGVPTSFDYSNLAPLPEDAGKKRSHCRKHHLNALVHGYNLVAWGALDTWNWMELYKVCRAPVTFVVDVWAGAGKKSAASVSMPFNTRTVTSCVTHTEHCLKVSDLQMLRETGREGSFWWKKEAHDEVNAAFPSLFRDFDVNTERMSLISDDEQESGNDD